MSEELIGEQIGSFLIQEELGRGGMGIVYRARDLALRRDVALKILAPHLLGDATARTRFQREINSTATIEHPSIVPVYAAGYERGFFFLAMRYIEGPDLWRIVQVSGPLREVRAMRLVGQVASALHTVHQQGMVHRDVKPQNVLVWNEGSSDEHAFLADFGIAKAIDDVNRLTRAGVPGTPGYMAPELLDGRPATPACDQYSLACLAFELLSGRLPVESQTSLARSEGRVPLPLAACAPAVSKAVCELVDRALSLDPNDRFTDVRAFVMSHEAAHEAFERTQAIGDAVASGSSSAQLVNELATSHGLSDAAIAEIADLEKSQVLRLRRRAARRSLIGE